MTSVLPKERYAQIFDAFASPLALLDLDFSIVAVNSFYEKASGRSSEYLIGKNIFDAFPGNPAEPDFDGVRNLEASLRRVLGSGASDYMPIQRYPITTDEHPDVYTDKFVSPVNSPIMDENGNTIAILHQVNDVTTVHSEIAQAMKLMRDESEASPLPEFNGEAQRRFAEFASASSSDTALHASLLTEIENLRIALTSRSAIDRAIGIVMNEKHCTEEAAFKTLATISQNSNKKLRTIADDLVRNTAR